MSQQESGVVVVGETGYDDQPVPALVEEMGGQTATPPAIGLMVAARRAGLTLPQDLAIVGFDDIAWAQYCDPPLTTVAQPMAELGLRAIELMLALLEDDPPGEAPGRHVTGRGELIVRASSG